jgi:hypothetical protein
MKPTVDKQTEAYLEQLEAAEKQNQGIEPYYNNPDMIDQMIIENNLQIAGLSFYRQIDLMLIVLNNKRVLKRDISDFKRLKSANISQLEKYKTSPLGVHWETLDEDISLRGLLKHELAYQDSPSVA